MLFSERNNQFIDAMGLIENISNSLKTVSWIWGGFTTDIYIGRILREHDDLDYLTLNLHQLKPMFEEAFSSNDWQCENLCNGDMKLRKDNLKVHLGNVELDNGLVKWTHNGEKGSLLFPVPWLNPNIVGFLEAELHVVAPELQYVLKEHPELLNPDWIIREKDIVEKKYLQDLLVKEKINVCSLCKLIISI